jgi:hypothetical protein
VLLSSSGGKEDYNRLAVDVDDDVDVVLLDRVAIPRKNFVVQEPSMRVMVVTRRRRFLKESRHVVVDAEVVARNSVTISLAVLAHDYYVYLLSSV